MSDIYSNFESSTKESVFWIVADVLGGKEKTSMKNCVGCLTDGTSNTKRQFIGSAFGKNSKRVAQPVSVDNRLKTLRM